MGDYSGIYYDALYVFRLLLSQVGDRRPTQGRPQRRNTKKKPCIAAIHFREQVWYVCQFWRPEVSPQYFFEYFGFGKGVVVVARCWYPSCKVANPARGITNYMIYALTLRFPQFPFICQHVPSISHEFHRYFNIFHKYSNLFHSYSKIFHSCAIPFHGCSNMFHRYSDIFHKLSNIFHWCSKTFHRYFNIFH